MPAAFVIKTTSARAASTIVVVADSYVGFTGKPAAVFEASQKEAPELDR
jgi:hypothetical protein